MVVKNLIRDLCPPIFWNWIRAIRRDSYLSFSGDYSSWQDAQKQSSGYDAEHVLQSVCDSALKVKKGEAVFERDSVCFYHEEFRWPVLACILKVAAKHDGNLNVLDFGGSLGSFYFQHQKFFSGLRSLRWAIIEQKQFVECGRENIEDEFVQFYDSIDACIAQKSVDVVLLSSVLQYLEDPYVVLASLAKTKVPYILIDRTPFISNSEDRLTVQRVPEEIYQSSYPAWFFSEEKFINAMTKLSYRLIAEFPCDENVKIGKFKGAFFERI